MCARVNKSAHREVDALSSACGYVGCVRRGCLRSNSASVCSQAAFRSRPFPDDFALPGPGPVHDRLDEPRLALATREWAETYVRPLLVRPLTVLQLPEIFRAGVFLSWLAEVGGEVCVVEIQFTTSVDGGHIFYAGTEGLELYSISVGSLDHCRVQLRHPSSGITALVLHDLSRLDFEQILAQVPNLEYLMHFDNGPNRNLSHALRHVPKLKYLDLSETLRGTRDETWPEFLRHVPCLEVLRCDERWETMTPAARLLKRGCCPCLREIYAGEYAFDWATRVRTFITPPFETEAKSPDCDGVVWREPRQTRDRTGLDVPVPYTSYRPSHSHINPPPAAPASKSPGASSPIRSANSSNSRSRRARARAAASASPEPLIARLSAAARRGDGRSSSESSGAGGAAPATAGSRARFRSSS